MDSEQSQAARGRARGRARSLAPQLEERPVEVQPPGGSQEAYSHMYVDEPEEHSPEDSDGNGNGNGGGNGNGNGGGNGNGKGGGNGNGNGRGGTPRGIPTRAELEEAARQREQLLLSDYVVSRPNPDFQKKGASQHRTLPTPTIVANYYGFKMHPQFQMRMYSVKVEPAVDETWKVKKLVRQGTIGSYMLSGFMLYATRPIKEESLVFQKTLEREADQTMYTITLEYVRDVEKTEPTMFQFYNVVVRQMQTMLEFKLLGRHFFDPEGKVDFPNWRLELWPGFQNSLRQQELGMLLNVESVWKVLQTNPILNILGNIRNQYNQQPGPDMERACSEAVVGMIVITMYNKKAYKISRIDFRATPNSTFETKQGPKSYVNYYREKYGVDIRVLNQPMLVSEPRERERRRGQGDIYLVPELCFPCGLNEELRTNFRLMKDLASCLHMPPNERVGTMQEFINRAIRNQEIDTTMKNWGIKINPEPVQFEGRYLNSDEILVGGNNRVAPDDKADWTNAFRNHRMLTPMRLSTWAIIVTSRDSQGVANLVGTMQRVSGPLGYQIQQPQIIRANDARQYPQKVEEAMAANRGKIDLLFAILPNNNAENYAAVKKRCTVDYGIPSQCFLSKNLTAKGLMSICTKMVVQMNAKQGGEPWGVVNPLKNVMILGFDVHHAGPTGGSSIGAMCATISASLGRYYSCVRRLSVREEVATTVAMMFEKCLDAYYEANGQLPARIFMYRDGVGEGQLRQVHEQEVQAFKDRIKAKYNGNESPKLTYIVVNKRINTRFFQRMPNGQFQNPRPGLVVDDVVTRPERYDFFLVSQTARQGCVGPTYYNVIYDESALPPDRIQMYTYKLCHLYYNWSGTVAVPAPCQNAHKLALQVGTAIKSPANERLKFLLHFL